MVFITVSHSHEKAGCKIIGMSTEDYNELKVAVSPTLNENEKLWMTCDPNLKRVFIYNVPSI